MIDTAGDEFKAHEQEYRQVLPLRTWAVVRVDGRAFHTYTKKMDQPFDEDFASIMRSVARHLCEQVSGAVLAYTQSDEISLVLTDTLKLETQPFCGGVVSKIVSLTASMATAQFNREEFYYNVMTGFKTDPTKDATFDSRVFTLPDEQAVLRYLIWRQTDARRNALNKLAEHHLGKKAIVGKSTGLRRQMLTDKGVSMVPYLEYEMGGLIRRDTKLLDMEYVDKRTQATQATQVVKDVERHFWTPYLAPLFEVRESLDDFLKDDLAAKL